MCPALPGWQCRVVVSTDRGDLQTRRYERRVSLLGQRHSILGHPSGFLFAAFVSSQPHVTRFPASESLTEKYSIYYQLLVSLHGCSQRAPRLPAQGIVDSPLCDFHSVKKRNNLILNINRLFSQALSAARVLVFRILLGCGPWLHLLRRALPPVVRRFHSYYGHI